MTDSREGHGGGTIQARSEIRGGDKVLAKGTDSRHRQESVSNTSKASTMSPAQCWGPGW